MEALYSYFKAEKSESLLFMLIGTASILIALFLFFKLKEPFFKGMAIPMVLIGSIALVVGSTVYFRTDMQVAELENKFVQNSTNARSVEISRMETVMKSFSTYKMVEAGFIAIGLLLLFLMKEKNFWMGIGLGMLIQGSIMITADIFAEKRGQEYIEWLRKT